MLRIVRLAFSQYDTCECSITAFAAVRALDFLLNSQMFKMNMAMNRPPNPCSNASSGMHYRRPLSRCRCQLCPDSRVGQVRAHIAPRCAGPFRAFCQYLNQYEPSYESTIQLQTRRTTRTRHHRLRRDALDLCRAELHQL